MTGNQGDQAFYSKPGADTTSLTPGAAAPDLGGANRLSGTTVATRDTSGAYVNPGFGVDNTDNTTCKTSGDCNYIDTKFRADKNARYEVVVENGNIHITKEDGTQQVVRPQEHHPAHREEYQRRSQNFYGPGQDRDSAFYGQSDPGFDSGFQPAPQTYYRPQQQFVEGPPPEVYYRRPDPGLSFMLGLFGGGGFHHRHHGYDGDGDYWRYRSQPVGYVPGGFMPISPGWSSQNSFGWGQNNWEQHRWGPGYFRPRIALNFNLNSDNSSYYQDDNYSY
ncbi:MAG TPA: hypothetical protein V6C97_09135 [Oculatellaceae cyanobacterium]